MPGTTPVNALRYALLSDTPNSQAAFLNLATDIDRKLLSVYATTAARDTAIPAPTAGMQAFVTGTGEQYIHNGTAWIGAVPRYAVKTADENLASSTVLQNDDHLFFSVEANSKYHVMLDLRHRTGDILSDWKFNFTAPASAVFVGTWRGNLNTGGDGYEETPGSLLTQILPTVDTNNDYPLWADGILVTSATAGTLNLQWAQLASSAGNNTVRQNSYMRILKIG